MTLTKIFGLKLVAREPILDGRTKEIIDDGINRQIQLGSFGDDLVAKRFAENVKKNCKKRHWKIWTEKV